MQLMQELLDLGLVFLWTEMGVELLIEQPGNV